MSELRLNLITREWVIVSTDRAKKPEDFRSTKDKKMLPEFLDTCPFCPGNEYRTANEVYRLGDSGDYRVRVVENRFAALSSTTARGRKNDGLKHLVTGAGRHEVIIESPEHNACIAAMPLGQVSDIIRVYRLRFEKIYDDPRIEHVIIFKNHGESSGTSLEHPHSQIVGIPITPLQVRSRIEETMRYFDNTGECLMCATLRDEISDGRRIILESRRFVSFVPYAALSPFHVWIFPKTHSADFGSITDDEISDLAFNFKTVLSKIHTGLDDPGFNLIIRSESPKECRSEYFHWYISIVPRVAQISGLELGTGIYVNPSIPEEVAAFLRETKTEPAY